jgi:hypothetical protein
MNKVAVRVGDVALHTYKHIIDGSSVARSAFLSDQKNAPCIEPILRYINWSSLDQDGTSYFTLPADVWCIQEFDFCFGQGSKMTMRWLIHDPVSHV